MLRRTLRNVTWFALGAASMLALVAAGLPAGSGPVAEATTACPAQAPSECPAMATEAQLLARAAAAGCPYAAVARAAAAGCPGAMALKAQLDGSARACPGQRADESPEPPPRPCQRATVSTGAQLV